MLSKHLTLVDMHSKLNSKLEDPSFEIPSSIRFRIGEFWKIPALELNSPTAAFYAIEVFERLSIPMEELFEHIPSDFQFWDLHCSEKLEGALFGSTRNLKNFSEISSNTPAWLHSLANLSKKPRIELLALLILRNCQLGIKALAEDLPTSVVDSLKARERVIDPWFKPNFDERPGDVLTSWGDYLAAGRGDGKQGRQTKRRPASESESTLRRLEDSTGVYAEVLRSRVLKDKPTSLEMIGSQFNLTKERVRQIEVKIRSALEFWITDSQQVAEARSEILKSASQIVRIEPRLYEVGSLSKKIGEWTAFEIICATSSELHTLDEFLSTHSESQLRDLVIDFTTNRSSLFGRVEFFELAEASNFDSNALFHVAISRSWIVEIAGQLFSAQATLMSRAEEVLGRFGAPMEIEEIFKFSPEKRSLRSLRNLLMSEAAFTRTSKSKFALSQWNLNGYSTIQEEIAKTLERLDPSDLKQLTQDLAERFGVSPSSVIAYASSWPFEVKNGYVSYSSNNRISTSKDPSEEKELWKCGGKLIWATEIKSEHKRGSGTPVPKALCKELGLTNDTHLDLATPLGTVLRLSLTGIHWALGSVRQILDEEALEPGDWCFFVFDRESLTVKRTKKREVERFEHLIGEFHPELEPRSLEQFEGALKEMLFLPSHYSVASVFSALQSRGDSELVGFLREIFPKNMANEIEDNHSNRSKFIVKSVD
jgi:hypothetical protein